MFKKLLVGMGIGAAKVDFEIHQHRVEVGGIISGTVRICGGSIDQQVDEAYIKLVVTSSFAYEEQVRSIKQEIGAIKVADKLLVRANSPEIIIPVRFKLPYNIPISSGRTKYYFETGLDVKNAIDPKDVDVIIITPNVYMQMIFDALYSLGFRDKPMSGDYNGRCQKFEYRPTRFMARKLDELEVYLTAEEDRINVLMEIDKKTRGYFGKIADELDLNERHVGFSIPYHNMQNVDRVAVMLKNVIEDEYKKIHY